MFIQRMKNYGFTLLEMLLVLVIGASIIALLTSYTTQSAQQARLNKTVMDMQLILNAALSYYNQYGKWPTNSPNDQACTDNASELDNYDGTSKLQTSGFIHSLKMVGATGYTYMSRITGAGEFIVINTQGSNSMKAAANAQIIAGQLPGGALTGNITACTTPVSTLAGCAAANPCYAVAQVPPPGQNLNNARSVNFAGIYNTGACVPMPVCPAGMTPQIIAVPTSASGNIEFSSVPITAPYPISSFTAYATKAPDNQTDPPRPPACEDQALLDPCYSQSTATPRLAGDGGFGSEAGNSTPINTGKYWRVCLQVLSPQERYNPTTPGNKIYHSNTPQWGKIAAFTRCAPTNENIGSNLTVWMVNK